MRLRSRLLIIVSVVWLLFLGIIYLGTNLYLLNNIKLYEKQEIDTNLSRMRSSIDQYLYALGTFTSDWGYYNYAYDFIEGKNKIFPSDNVNLLTLANSHINMFLYLDKQGNIILGVMTDPKYKKFIAYLNGLEKYIYPGSVLEQHEKAIKSYKKL